MEIEQLVVCKECRQVALEMSHNILIARHQGKDRTSVCVCVCVCVCVLCVCGVCVCTSVVLKNGKGSFTFMYSV